MHAQTVDTRPLFLSITWPGYKARSAQEASLQCAISTLLTHCLFQQTALSNHGRFKPDPCLFLYNGTRNLYFWLVSGKARQFTSSLYQHCCTTRLTSTHKNLLRLSRLDRSAQSIYLWIAPKNCTKCCLIVNFLYYLSHGIFKC